MPRKPRFQNLGSSRGIKEALDPDTLGYLYVDQMLSQSEIARRHGCTPQYVSLLLKEYGIRRRGERASQEREE